MTDLDNGPTRDQIREYGSHVGFTWAVSEQHNGVGSDDAARAFLLATQAHKSPLCDFLADETRGDELLRYVAQSIEDAEAGHAAELPARFWRTVAQKVGMDNIDGVPHKTSFVQGFLDAQWLVFYQNTYHGDRFGALD